MKLNRLTEKIWVSTPMEENDLPMPIFTVLSPCGICQERLRYWGTDVKVGITTLD